MPGSAARIFAVQPAQSHLVPARGYRVLVGQPLGLATGCAVLYLCQHPPARNSLAHVVDQPNLHPPLHRLGRETSIVVGVVQASEHQHVNAKVTDLRLRRVHREGPHQRAPSIGQCDQLLPGHLRSGHHVVIEERIDATRQNDLSLDFGKRRNRRVLNPDLMHLVVPHADHMQLVHVLVMVNILRVRRRGKVGKDQMVAIDHRNRLGQARIVALRLQGISRTWTVQASGRGHIGGRQGYQCVDQYRTRQGNARGGHSGSQRARKPERRGERSAIDVRHHHHGDHQHGAQGIFPTPAATALG